MDNIVLVFVAFMKFHFVQLTINIIEVTYLPPISCYVERDTIVTSDVVFLEHMGLNVVTGKGRFLFY
jgi:hypothetical protein